ncbi:MAG: Gfo/Idh/MocA family oxidoreductase [Acidobacteriota bacterium]
MDSRRKFVGQVAYGLAGTLAAGPVRALGANDRVRIGLIGAGDRGVELANHLRACGNAEIVAVADIYSKNLDRLAAATGAKGYADHRALLDQPGIDAVVIATPQHLHAAHFRDALGARKHVYLEKTAAFTVAEAKQMRSAYRASTQVVQIGHQACSSGHVADVQQFLSDPDRLGKLTAIGMQMHRNTPAGKAQWARPALFTPELTEANVDWQAFDPRGFDANRFVHWRYFWDYSGGTAYEYMSQQLSFWYKALDLQIPHAATMEGGIYLWKDGREVPDTVSVTFQQPEEILISWMAGLGNNQLGVSEDALGTNGSITRATQVKYTPQKMNRPDLKEMLGRTAHTPQAHMQNFLEAIRLGTEPNCSFDLGFRVSIACRMAMESYRQGRTVRWDARREEIV